MSPCVSYSIVDSQKVATSQDTSLKSGRPRHGGTHTGEYHSAFGRGSHPRTDTAIPPLFLALPGLIEDGKCKGDSQGLEEEMGN